MQIIAKMHPAIKPMQIPIMSCWFFIWLFLSLPEFRSWGEFVGIFYKAKSRMDSGIGNKMRPASKSSKRSNNCTII